MSTETHKMDEPLVHWAGPHISLREKDGRVRVIQRCMICGEKIMDVVVTNEMELRAAVFGTFEMGDWVRQKKNGRWKFFNRASMSENAPSNCCVVLVEA